MAVSLTHFPCLSLGSCGEEIPGGQKRVLLIPHILVHPVLTSDQAFAD